MNDIKYWIALKLVKGIGEIKFLSLLEKYKYPEYILKEILKPENLKNLIYLAEKEIERCKKFGIEIITYDNEKYPEELKNIPNPPPFLYTKGDINLLQQKDKIAVVGSRNPSNYGRKIAEVFIPEIIKFDIIIVSGLARGIDGIAHKLTLNNNGKTIAVTGCGLNIIYPSEHKKLYSEIAENGLIITEFSLDTPPEASNFPKRNRIISALSKGVVVVEAGKKSGSIITAMYAVEQGKDVFAFPGNIFSYKSMGAHYLIKNGAFLVENARDILEIAFPEKLNFVEEYLAKDDKICLEDEREILIYNLLKQEPLSIDNIVLKSKLKFSDVSSILTLLQMKGLVYEQTGKIFFAI